MTGLTRRARLPTTADITRLTPLFAAAAYVVVMAATLPVVSWDVWAGLVIVPVLFALSMPLLQRGLRHDPDPGIGRIVVIAFGAKMLGSLARYVLTSGLYAGRSDAVGYDGAGGRLARAFWDGTFAQAMEIEVPELTGTPFINLVTGLLYIVTGPTMIGGYLFFAWLSFLGLFFFYKAVVVGFPEANHRRYAYLVFFLPSMLYWPSSLGKDAWICFGLGLASYGVALVTRHQPLGYPVAALGLLATAGPRPHITVLSFVSLMMAYVLRRKSWSDAKTGPIGKVVGLVVLMAVGAVVVAKAASFFEVDAASSGSVTSVLDRAATQSGQGGSEYEAVQVKSPAQFPNAVLAVVFRPFPWEASNAQSLISAAEGVMLLILFATSAPKLLRLPKYLFRVPYVAYAVAYSTMFVIAFSSISNFGIMARQRTQVLPLLLVLLVLPDEAAGPAPPEDDREPAGAGRGRHLARAGPGRRL